MDETVKAFYDGPADARGERLAALDAALNASCLTFRLSYAGRSALFTADVPSGHWDRLVASGYPLASDIMQFPHHGHADAISKGLVEAVAPSHIAFCVSEDNRFGCPEPEVFGYLPASARLYATGRVALPPDTALTRPHRAVVFEIGEDSRIDSRLEYT